jgi:acyl-CoA thioester hydrolase
MSRWAPDRTHRDGYPGPGIDLPILYNDLDPNRHLNNVALGRFFEHARVLVNRDLGLHTEIGTGRALVARVAIDYVSEGFFGTPLHVRTRVARLGTSSVTLEQAAWQDERCVGLSEVVLVHLSDDRPAPWPDALRARLEVPT